MVEFGVPCFIGFARKSLRVWWMWSFLSFFMASAAGAVSYRDLMPEPVSVVDKKGDPFVVNDRTKIVYPQDHAQWKRTAEFLAGYVEGMTGYRLPVEECRSSESEPVISSEDNVIRFQCDSRMRKDGFKLSVGKYGVVIQAADGAGVFYAVQLLRQLLLSGAEQIQTERTQKEQIQTQQTIAASSAKTLNIPPVELEDYPSLSYRGAMLDVSRHFFSVAQVKRVIDLLAFHRLNHFHWHLTDDQGWRADKWRNYF